MSVELIAEKIESKVTEIKSLYDGHDAIIKDLQGKIAQGLKPSEGEQVALADAVKRIDQAEAKHLDLVNCLKAEVTELAQKMAASTGKQANAGKSIGEMIAEKKEIGNYRGGVMSLGTYEGTSYMAGSKDITSIPLNNTLINPMREPGIIYTDKPLSIRDLLVTANITTNAVEYVKRTGVTRNAGIQVAEGDAYTKTGVTFGLESVTVKTIGNWVPASRQALQDAGQIQDIIDRELRMNLRLHEEAQLLYGDGTGANLRGINTSAIAYSQAQTGETSIDRLRRAILQVRKSFYNASAIVMSPEDWADLELSKDTTGQYLFARPFEMTTARLWGRRVVESDAITAGDFLVGDFAMGATLYDRQQIDVRIAEQHDNFAIRGMVAFVADERIALAVQRPDAFVRGQFV